MDTIEATKMVMSRIQNIDPDNASKIMGYILIQDQGENEMIRLAFGPENLLASVIKQAKAFLDISSNTSSAPSSPSPFGHQRSPRIIIPNNGFHPPPPLSPHSPWSSSGSFPDRRSSPRAASYASVVNGGGSSASFYNNFGDVTEDYSSNSGLQVVTDQLSFLDNSKNVDFMDPIMSPGGRSDSILFPYPNGGTDWGADGGNCGDAHHHLHRRSCSVNDVFLGGGGNDDVGNGLGGWRPCMYFARGFCKNGTSCKFIHGNGGFGDEMCLGSSSPTAVVGSPTGNIDGIEEFLRIKAIQQQQRIAAMAAGGGGGPHHFPFNRCMNFLNEGPRSPSAAALMMGEDFHKFGRFRPDRHDFAAMGLGSSSSRQIYLTFPADSTFKEEDVSNYFSIFGPVQDVRIPYQQKRMFGFVTFVLPETVKAILAKGNPHFVCDSRVLVKPYKEKGKIPDKKHQQQIERSDFSGCLSPSVLESAEPFDHIPFGARMFNHEMMLRRKLEGRAELQQAIDLQDRKLMNMQLTDLNNHQLHHNLTPISAPTLSHAQTNQSLLLSSDDNNENVVSGDINGSGIQGTMDPITNASDLKVQPEVNDDDGNNSGNSSEKEESSNLNEIYNHESFEHILPDNLFASPTKTAATDHQSIFSMPEANGGVSASSSSSDTTPVLPANSTALNMASLKSCYFQMPRSFCGQEAIEM